MEGLNKMMEELNKICPDVSKFNTIKQIFCDYERYTWFKEQGEIGENPPNFDIDPLFMGEYLKELIIMVRSMSKNLNSGNTDIIDLEAQQDFRDWFNFYRDVCKNIIQRQKIKIDEKNIVWYKKGDMYCPPIISEYSRDRITKYGSPVDNEGNILEGNVNISELISKGHEFVVVKGTYEDKKQGKRFHKRKTDLGNLTPVNLYYSLIVKDTKTEKTYKVCAAF